MKEIRKSGTKKVRRKKVKRRARARITVQKKGVQGFIASHALMVFNPGSDQRANIENLTSFLVSHSKDKLFLVSDIYLNNLRAGLKQYYFRQSKQFRTFYIPLTFFLYSFILSKSNNDGLSVKSYGLLFICLLYCITKKVDSFRAFDLRQFTDQYFDYRLRWAYFQKLIKAGYLVKLSSHVYKLAPASYALQVELTSQLNYFYEEQIESINSAFASIK